MNQLIKKIWPNLAFPVYFQQPVQLVSGLAMANSHVAHVVLIHTGQTLRHVHHVPRTPQLQEEKELMMWETATVRK